MSKNYNILGSKNSEITKISDVPSLGVSLNSTRVSSDFSYALLVTAAWKLQSLKATSNPLKASLIAVKHKCSRG